MKQVALEGFLKKFRDVPGTIAIAKMELFVALVSSVQLLTNFTKTSNIGAMTAFVSDTLKVKILHGFKT